MGIGFPVVARGAAGHGIDDVGAVRFYRAINRRTETQPALLPVRPRSQMLWP